MNFYQHHIGDFNNATRHLSRVERSIYRDLLELYYDTESPLTSDLDRLARRCIVDDNDRPAMREVLNEFFTLQDDGYHNTRADAEISAYQRMAEGGKRGAEKRWGKAKDSPHIAPLSPPHTKGNANHEPVTMNHEPVTIKNTKNTKATVVATPDGVSDSVFQDFKKLRTAKRSPLTQTALAGITREAAKAGLPLSTVLAMCCERGWVGFKAEWLSEKRTGYLPPQPNETVPSRQGIDPTLAQLIADRKNTKPPSLEIRAQLAKLRSAA